MAYDRQFLRVSFLYDVLGTSEIAQTDLAITSVSGSPTAAAMLAQYTEEDLEALAALLVDFLASDTIEWANYSRLHAVKMSPISTTGAVAGEPLLHELDGATIGTHSQVHPQLSVVLSLWSGSTIGKGNYGRMYLPHTAVPLVASTPLGDAVDAGFNAAHGAVLVRGVNTLAEEKTDPGFMAIMSSAGSGHAKAIAQVRCGIVTDTQRRRYDDLAPAYALSPV